MLLRKYVYQKRFQNEEEKQIFGRNKKKYICTFSWCWFFGFGHNSWHFLFCNSSFTHLRDFKDTDFVQEFKNMKSPQSRVSKKAQETELYGSTIQTLKMKSFNINSNKNLVQQRQKLERRSRVFLALILIIRSAYTFCSWNLHFFSGRNQHLLFRSNLLGHLGYFKDKT